MIVNIRQAEAPKKAEKATESANRVPIAVKVPAEVADGNI